MRNCNCNSKCDPATMPGPVSHNHSCECKPDKITLRTVVIPANMGTDAEGEAYAPKAGTYYNTIVHYLANGAVYIYDSNGVFTEVLIPSEVDVEEAVKILQQQMDELYTPAKIGLFVNSVEELEALPADAVGAGEMVQVTKDATHNGVDSLYYYNPGSAMWTYAYAATPYYTKEFVDSVITALQTNINNVMNKEVEDVNNLQTNINAEIEAREAADNAINDSISDLDQRIEDIVNSPDVRYIVDTYADLEAIDKSTIGDQDYARVLQDETHDNASTYYQFNKTSDEWAYVGQTGPYYTKEQIDTTLESYATISYVNEQIGNINSALDEINGEVPEETN